MPTYRKIRLLSLSDRRFIFDGMNILLLALVIC